MKKLKLLACAAIAAFGAAACASGGDGDRASAAAAPAPMARMSVAPQTVTPAPAPGTYSDAQLQAFAAASLEIDPISRSLAGATPEQQATATTQIRTILQQHDLDGETYNAIASRAQTDTVLAARIAAAQTALQPAQPQSESGDAPATEPDSAPSPQ